MTTPRAFVVLLMVAGLVVSGIPAGAELGPGPDGASEGEAREAQPSAVREGNTSPVEVAVGDQLATVIQATDAETRTAVGSETLAARLAAANESEKAVILADRAAALRAQARAIRTEYRNATAAYEAGNLTRAEYARRLATLAARATSVLTQFTRLQQRAANVSTFDLRAAGYSRSDLRAALGAVDVVSGPAAEALFERFVGEGSGEVSLETNGGLSITVEREDGERSREITRQGDNRSDLVVEQATALETARTALTNADRPTDWRLTRARVDRDAGTYAFRFQFAGKNLTGEAEVVVDGSSGAVIKLEEELSRADPDDGDDSEATDGELAIVITEGVPAPNATVTVGVFAAGSPVPNATVRVGETVVGTTGSNGTVAVTLPDASEVTITATRGETSAELEFEFGDEEDRELTRGLQATGTVRAGTASLQVSSDGRAVRNATVSVEGTRVGTTDATGRVSFPAPDAEEFTVTLGKGSLTVVLTVEVDDGVITLEDAEISDGEESDDESGEGDDGELTDDDDNSSDDGDDSDDGEDGDDGTGSETESDDD